MELRLPALAETQRAFDAVAPTYHRDNAANPIICRMRERTMARVTAHVTPGSMLLDLGCGPGADAVHLAREGYRVTAIDCSPAMVAQARQRVAGAALAARVDVLLLGIHELDRLAPVRFDAAYSDLGPLNCVPDLAGAVEAIRQRLRPGGVFVASVIGRRCPWEIARYAIAGNWRRIRTRFAEGFVSVPLDGRTVWTRYYLPSAFEAAFVAGGFRTLSLEALGLFLPPPYLRGFYERHRLMMRGLEAIERRTARWPGMRQLGDHFLIAMVRT
jgi:SAM-dependent methyltransferase